MPSGVFNLHRSRWIFYSSHLSQCEVSHCGQRAHPACGMILEDEVEREKDCLRCPQSSQPVCWEGKGRMCMKAAIGHHLEESRQTLELGGHEPKIRKQSEAYALTRNPSKASLETCAWCWSRYVLRIDQTQWDPWQQLQVEWDLTQIQIDFSILQSLVSPKIRNVLQLDVGIMWMALGCYAVKLSKENCDEDQIVPIWSRSVTVKSFDHSHGCIKLSPINFSCGEVP